MEQHCINWDEHSFNLSQTFKDLRSNSDFSDVTLACTDGQQFNAHKVVLSADSEFFKNILKINQKNYPLIYMRGMTSSDLTNIMDCLYYGEVNIDQNDIDDFLSIAEDLQLKGLSTSDNQKLPGMN